MKRDVYSGYLKLHGEESLNTLGAANNYAGSLLQGLHVEEAKSLLRKALPVARRALAENHDLTLKLRWTYAKALYDDPGATLDDLREGVTMLEDVERIARRVLGGAHPTTTGIEDALRKTRDALESALEE